MAADIQPIAAEALILNRPRSNNSVGGYLCIQLALLGGPHLSGAAAQVLKALPSPL